MQSKLIVLLVLINRVSCNFIKTSNYSKLPKLFQYDDFDKCDKDPDLDGFYCVTRSYIQPDEFSPIWRDIKFISEANAFHRLRHFRHEIIFAGICLSRCKSEIEEIEPNLFNNLLVHDPVIDPSFHGKNIPIFEENFVSHRRKFHGLVNRCFNHRLFKNYSLKAYSEIEFCMADSSKGFDFLDVSFIVFVQVAAGLVLLSILSDFQLNFNKFLNFGTIKELKKRNKLGKYLDCFSIRINFHKFYHRTPSTLEKNLKNGFKPGQLKEKFIFLDAVRIPLSCFNIIAHAMLMLSMLPATNPEFYEASRYDFIMKLGSNVPLSVLIFHGISAFLLTLNDANRLENGTVFHLTDLIQALKKRCLRLLPLYMAVLLFEATLIRKFGYGPGWEGLAGRQWAYCRSNWWTNLLFINNFINVNQQCILPTWYLASDMQLFIMRFFLVALISRAPRFKRLILFIAISVSFVVTAHAAYTNDINDIYMTETEHFRTFHSLDKKYQNYHIPFHTNTGSYLVGMIGAFIYHTIKRRKINLHASTLFKFIWKWNKIYFLALLLIPVIFQSVEFERPSLWIALHASLHKHIAGVQVIILILGFTAGFGGRLRQVTSHHSWKLLGKLSYGAFLVHVSVFKILVGSVLDTGTLTISLPLLVNISLATVLCSYLTALVLHLCIEIPVQQLLEIYSATNKNGKTLKQ